MIELTVAGMRLDDETPVLLLRERGGDRVLPIWISSVDGAAIALALEEEKFLRPLTHDVLVTVLELLAGEDDPVLTITGVSDGVFRAEIKVGAHVVDARPSDAVAVAVRRDWLLQCPTTLMDTVGVSVNENPPDEVELFREFLDQVQPEDF
ncbi:MAG: bifunctional nuclease family protein [Propionibacteriaceae bacterium]|nr:bifunctional nuclease family protein [Propionibacteriaceae bacterium]